MAAIKSLPKHTKVHGSLRVSLFVGTFMPEFSGNLDCFSTMELSIIKPNNPGCAVNFVAKPALVYPGVDHTNPA